MVVLMLSYSTGCINALDWSANGSSLASGSDDTRCVAGAHTAPRSRASAKLIHRSRVCIWKLGQEPDSTFPDNPDIVQRYPALGLGLSAV